MMEWTTGDLVWFDAGFGHPLPGEIQEVHQAAQIIVVQAVINGKVSKSTCQLYLILQKTQQVHLKSKLFG